MKRYTRDYREEPFDCEINGVRIVGVFKYGKMLYDPDALFWPHDIPRDQIADPNDKTLHVEEIEE